MKALGWVVVAMAVIWGGTYIPLTSPYALNLVVAPQPTVRMPYSLLASDGTARVHKACKHVPFLLRPIADRPNSVRLVITRDGSTLAVAIVSCATGKLVRMKKL